MAELVTELVKAVLETLGSPFIREIEWIFGVKDELSMITTTLSAINSVLLDAQEKQLSNNSTRLWLKEVKDIAYDIEDVLDLIATQDLELRVHGRSLRRRITRLFVHYDVARELKSIRRRLEHTANSLSSFSFQERWSAPPTVSETVTARQQKETYSYVREDLIVGRDADKERIINAVLSPPSCKAGLSFPVIPIVGLGGIGKTAIVKLVYNDHRVAAKFGLRLWACVSNKYVFRTLIEDIIQSATGDHNFSHLNMEALQRRLCDALCGQTFLLVLDDVWIEDPNEWLELKELLAVGSSESTIVVTTREERVAFITGTAQTYRIKGLSDDQCLAVFLKSAFREGEEEEFPLLLEIGKSIARKCHGVPLAAKTLGSLLRTNRAFQTWKRIEESEFWDIEQKPNDILPALKVSFDQTPHYLRPCFSTCAIYPKDAYIERDEVIFMWIALGLSPGEEGLLSDRYFNALVLRSFFQVVRRHDDMVKWLSLTAITHLDPKLLEADIATWFSPRDDLVLSIYEQFYGKITSFQMHDLVHDLAMCVIGEELSVVSCGSHSGISSRARHIAWDADDLSEAEFPRGLSTANKARTFSFRYKMGAVSKSFLEGVVSNCKCLRVLLLSNSEFEELPASVGYLKHLRYLNLARNYRLRVLPNSLCKLVNLQTLDISQCDQLECLPRDMDKLISLRHLLFTSRLKTFPERVLCGWTSLELLVITNCKYLTSLPEEVGSLSALRFLRIVYCPSMVSLPNSIGHLTSLLELKIWSCERLDLMGWQGLYRLRNLHQLNIQGLPRLSYFPGGFQSMGMLQFLILKRCGELRALPECLRYCIRLLKLVIFMCPKLCSLPSDVGGLKNLQDLWIVGCPELIQRCERGTGDYWNMISYIPTIQLEYRLIQKRGIPC